MRDVLICGGGLAGLTLARQLRRESPSARVTVVDRASRPFPDATHKVGESSVELGSRYFEHTLGLKDYLLDKHLIKNGLRFFVGGGTLPIADRTELGPPQLPVIPSFQIDRGRFENDLRAMCEADGTTLIEGVSVESVELGEPHRARLSDGRTIEADWLVDATGRRRLLTRQLGLGLPSGHTAHSAWFRVSGRLNIEHLVPASDTEWHGHDPDNIRWLSTSHLMGRGYWVWIIPLSSGLTSIGVVAHGEVHPFDSLRTLERALAWMAVHEPVLHAHIQNTDAHVVQDFRCLKDFSYTTSRCYDASRWACVGEAGAFVDPFYSPGSDFIALANVFCAELIAHDIAGDDIAPYVEHFDWFYRRMASLSTVTYRDAADAYGKPRVMAAKIYWDNFSYWSFVCQYFFQEIFRLELAGQKRFDDVAERFAQLNLRAQMLFKVWGREASDVPVRRHQIMPPIPSELANLHLDLGQDMSPDDTRAYMNDRADRAEEVLTEMVLRAVTELGPEKGRALVEEIGAGDWTLRAIDARVAADAGPRRGRRKRLSKIARDVERCLGTVNGSLVDAARDVLGVTQQTHGSDTVQEA